MSLNYKTFDNLLNKLARKLKFLKLILDFNRNLLLILSLLSFIQKVKRFVTQLAPYRFFNINIRCSNQPVVTIEL